MEDKLREIFKFLKKNRCYNSELQKKCYIADISPYDSASEKVLSLLYRVANTQSQPKIDNLSESIQGFVEDKGCMESFEGFIKHISNKDYKAKNKNKTKEEMKYNYNYLYLGMKDLPGWGEKTAALFVKTIFHLHNGKHSNNLRIWKKGVPKTITSEDSFKLPVDAVIIHIFNNIGRLKKKRKGKPTAVNWSFSNINTKIREFSDNNNDIEIWDDLWFWGFITQKSNSKSKRRKLEWNDSKYWALRDSDKNSRKITAIKKRAETFISILE